MEKIVINGGNKLYGDIYIDGMKNAALPIIFACILTGDKCVIENLPPVSDINVSLEILRSMGASVRLLNKTTAEIDTTHVIGGTSPYDLASKMRAYSAFFDKYRENVVADVSEVVNDTYLKVQGTEGTRSYGMVTDLAVAYYKKVK